MRRIILLLVLLALLVLGWIGWRNFSLRQKPAVTIAATIVKQPVNFANRTFDPQNPPSDMPPMSPAELAVCDSNFIANANVVGQSRLIDYSHVLLTITHVNVTLQLNINIWVPIGATDHVIEHEQGHRQISEYFYRTADQLAQQIAAKYLGKEILITGADWSSQITSTLQQISADITEEYGKKLNPDPAQLRYDAITDHSRNDLSASDAVAQVLNDASLVTPIPPTNPQN